MVAKGNNRAMKIESENKQDKIYKIRREKRKEKMRRGEMFIVKSTREKSTELCYTFHFFSIFIFVHSASLVRIYDN